MGNNIGDEAVIAIANALKTNTTLTTLNIIMGNNIGDEGAKAIAEALERNKKNKYIKNTGLNRLAADYSNKYYREKYIEGIKMQNTFKADYDKLKINTTNNTLFINSNKPSQTTESNTNDIIEFKDVSKKNSFSTYYNAFKLLFKKNLTKKSLKIQSSNQKSLKKKNNSINLNIEDPTLAWNFILYIPLFNDLPQQLRIKNIKAIKDIKNNDQILKDDKNQIILEVINDFDRIVNNQQRLPPEIWRIIFSHLNLIDLKNINTALTIK